MAKDMREKTILILSCGYIDGSGYKVLRAYINRDRANEDMELAESNFNFNHKLESEWRITEVPIIWHDRYGGQNV